MLRRLAGAAAIPAALLAAASDRLAASDEPPRRAEALDRQIEWLEGQLAELEGEAENLSRDLELLATREALSRRLLQRAVTQRGQVALAVARETARLESLGEAMESSRLRAAAALREIYKQSSMAGYASVLSVADPRQILRGIQSLDVVARRQREAVAAYSEQRRDAQSTRERLSARSAELEATIRDGERESRDLAEARAGRLALLERVDRERRLHDQARAELRRAALEMEKAIAGLAPGQPLPAVTIDFERLRGSLPWPGEGPLLRSFGEVRHPRFGTVTPHPGWDIQVAPGASVSAVAAGRVVFSRRFGGYGPTVVIDHGGRYLSVYARLAASTVPEGTDLLPGQEVGFAPEAGADGKSSVYFEIRYQGQAVDPDGWLRRSGSRETTR
jgi:septal ring factor EnvC (AmiA/AmiB activator)